MKHNPQLDAMRAVAALAIIAHHYLLFPAGWIGVQFFFVLSGFLISGIIIKGKEQYKKTGIIAFFKNFYQRRILRLFPLYYGYVFILGLFYFFVKKPEAFNIEWPWILTYSLNFRWLFHNYSFHMVYGHLWSLSAEWQFYLVWPLFLWYLPKKYTNRWLLWLIPVAMLIRIAVYVVCNHLNYLVGFNGNAESEALAPYVLPFSHLDAFVFGTLLCNTKFRKAISKPVVVYSCIAITVTAGFTLIWLLPSYQLTSLGWPSNLPLAYQWVWGYSLLNITSAAIIAAMVEGKGARFFEFTNIPLLQYLGKISYGIYVYHPLIIFAALNYTDKLPSFPGKSIVELVFIVIITSVIAHFSYKYWEKPFLKKKKQTTAPEELIPEPKPDLKPEMTH
jgi:peptidoglycan/LPS O-acetylase OafA/YrhL